MSNKTFDQTRIVAFGVDPDTGNRTVYDIIDLVPFTRSGKLTAKFQRTLADLMENSMWVGEIHLEPITHPEEPAR